MDLKACYMEFEGDYDNVMGRLKSEQLILRFLNKFLTDKSFELFETAMGEKDYDEALRGVHTLKGICQNLSFSRLYESSSRITNALKEKDYNKAVEMAPELAKDYYMVVNAVKKYNSAMEV